MNARRQGKPHGHPWKRAKRNGNQCCYCRESFSNRNPPTADHVVPVSVGGSKGKTVLACQLCNQARGNAPFETYLAAVETERAESKAEKRRYRRPKLYTAFDGTQTITTATRRERMSASGEPR
jgi:hypothetical protein